MTDTLVANETLVLPLGDLPEAEIRLGFGGGEMTLGRAEPGILISGTFDGGVVNKSKREGCVELEPAHPARALMAGCRLNWDVRLTAEIPIDLRLETGGNRSVIDLTPLRIRHLAIDTGASETNVTLPGAGETKVRVDCGFASVNLAVPEGVAALIRGKMGLGSINVNESRFPRSPDGWASPDYETAADRVAIDISGGFGSVTVG